jgi:hypothetical protein
METPSQEIFDEMKAIATEIWNTYDNKYGYVDEKLGRLSYLTNVEDNAMISYRMFDTQNQTTFFFKASPEVRDYIKNNL